MRSLKRSTETWLGLGLPREFSTIIKGKLSRIACLLFTLLPLDPAAAGAVRFSLSSSIGSCANASSAQQCAFQPSSTSTINFTGTATASGFASKCSMKLTVTTNSGPTVNATVISQSFSGLTFYSGISKSESLSWTVPANLAPGNYLFTVQVVSKLGTSYGSYSSPFQSHHRHPLPQSSFPDSVDQPIQRT